MTTQQQPLSRRRRGSSVDRLLRRSRDLRRISAEMFDDQRRRALTPQPSRRATTPSPTSNIERLLNEARTEVKELQREDAGLILEMQHLYRDIRKISSQVFSDPWPDVLNSRSPSSSGVSDVDSPSPPPLERRQGGPIDPVIRQAVPQIEIESIEMPADSSDQNYALQRSGSVGDLPGVVYQRVTRQNNDLFPGSSEDTDDCMCADCEQKRLLAKQRAGFVRPKSAEPAFLRSRSVASVSSNGSAGKDSRKSLQISSSNRIVFPEVEPVPVYV